MIKTLGPVSLGTIIKMTALSEDLLVTVNKLQDLVFNTIGNDSLDLPQIVSPFNVHPARCHQCYGANHLCRLLWALSRPANHPY